MSDLILDKYSKLPKEIQEQVLEYIEFLLLKYKKNNSNESPEKQKSNYGSAKGLIIVSDDFDEPLDDFDNYI